VYSYAIYNGKNITYLDGKGYIKSNGKLATTAQGVFYNTKKEICNLPCIESVIS
jgi:hypothetical protein